MIDILKGVATGRWSTVLGWILPATLFAGVLAFFVFPSLDHLPVFKDVADLTPAQRLLALAFFAVVLGLFLNAINVYLYRPLEGYSRFPFLWSDRIETSRVEFHRRRKRELVERARSEEPGWKQGLAFERALQYPADDAEVLPTAFGNAIRAFETYGYDRFGLDSQALWSELYAMVDESLREEYAAARAGTDQFVALFWLAGLFSGISLVTASLSTNDRLQLAVVGSIAFVTLPFWYLAALKSTRYWQSTHQAIVNLGRPRLAEALGFLLPRGIERERELWTAIAQYVTYWSADTEGVKSKLETHKADPRRGQPPPPK